MYIVLIEASKFGVEGEVTRRTQMPENRVVHSSKVAPDDCRLRERSEASTAAPGIRRYHFTQRESQCKEFKLDLG